jgi:hypothetical protein
LDDSLEADPGSSGRNRADVSILVLLDDSLEDRPILTLFGCISIKMLEISA